MDFGIRLISHLELISSTYKRKYVDFYTESFIFPTETSSIDHFVSASVLKNRIEALPARSTTMSNYAMSDEYELMPYSGSFGNLFFVQPDIKYISYVKSHNDFFFIRKEKRMKFILNQTHSFFQTFDAEYVMFLGNFVCQKIGLPSNALIHLINFYLSNAEKRQTKLKGEIITTKHIFDGLSISTNKNDFIGSYNFVHASPSDVFSFNIYEQNKIKKPNLEIRTYSSSNGFSLILNGMNSSSLTNFKAIECKKFIFDGFAVPSASFISYANGEKVNGKILFLKMNGETIPNGLSCQLWITKSPTASLIAHGLPTASYSLHLLNGTSPLDLNVNKINKLLTIYHSGHQTIEFELRYDGASSTATTSSVYFNLIHDGRWFQWSSVIKQEP